MLRFAILQVAAGLVFRGFQRHEALAFLAFQQLHECSVANTLTGCHLQYPVLVLPDIDTARLAFVLVQRSRLLLVAVHCTFHPKEVEERWVEQKTWVACHEVGLGFDMHCFVVGLGTVVIVAWGAGGLVYPSCFDEGRGECRARLVQWRLSLHQRHHQ